MKKLAIAISLVFTLFCCCTGSVPESRGMLANPPVAIIDSIRPDKANPGETITFSGYGVSSGRRVVAYQWSSSIDGDFSQMASFVTSSLSEGTHTILFRVEDDSGVWSAQVKGMLSIAADKPVSLPIIDYFQATPGRISLGTSSVLGWHVSGATTVYIDPDIGNVASVGNIKVSPALSTQYTLTASNEGNRSSSSLVTVLVVPARTGLPVINSFDASPGNIQTGGWAALKWNVFNADAVKIDPGLGIVEPVGSLPVIPSKTTTYTLTAYNSVGMVVSTTQVMVTTSSVSGSADLVITDISKVETPAGARIIYTVENKGTNDAPPSTTKLYANGVYRASDRLGMVSAGASVSRQVSDWMYNPATSIIKVVIDADNNLVETDKANNSKMVTVPVRTVIDFVENAKDALWGVEYPYKSLVFGGIPIEKNGFVSYQIGKKMEDGSESGRVLEARPVSTFNGWIRGDYMNGWQVKPGDTFYGLVCLLEGAQSGDVEFWVYIRPHGQQEWDVLVPGVWDLYDYKVRAMAVLIPPVYFGKNVDFSLVVSTHGDPLQDWATWIEAKILR